MIAYIGSGHTVEYLDRFLPSGNGGTRHDPVHAMLRLQPSARIRVRAVPAHWPAAGRPDRTLLARPTEDGATE
jgi:hypothetical protein